MSKSLWALVVAAVALAACASASGNRRPSNLTGDRPPPPAFAQAMCAGCHAIEPYELSPNPQAPTFVDIVNRGGVTKPSLRRFLLDAHNYPEIMEFDLEPHHVDLLTNYMMTLKDPKYRQMPR